MDEDLYKTIAKPGTALFKDRGSKFFAEVFPIRNEEDFKARLDEIKKEHHQARHHCYAFRHTPDQLSFRANDDGEPAHSAGTPILHALQSAELINVGAVVTRYFGGTKLGVSGLINAYRSATDEAIAATKIIEKTLEHGGLIKTDYGHMSQVLYLIDKWGANIDNQKLEYDCEYNISIRRRDLEAFQKEVELLESTTFVRTF